ncbi:DUF1294 domain-containing protein [Pseudomonas sp. SIMBA_077]
MKRLTKDRREAYGASERPGASIRHLKLKLLVLALLCAMPLGGSLSVLLSGITRVPLLIYGVASVLAFALYAYDKQCAKSARWRIPEKALHCVELLGGWPGALVAQQVLRHKTRKVSYQVWFWLIVAVHQAVWVDVLFLKVTFLN